MARNNITELTEAEFISQNEQKVFRPAFMQTPAIPASYDGKYALFVALAVDVQATESQMNALETAIEAIANVHKAFVLIGPARLPLDRVPANHDLKIRAEASFGIDEQA